ncbi:MAG TPA: hypothetical protein VHW00_21310 [Thermoanaerobaculia bacterium]|nr:hypothetical protein [Thermoanaerobaculia bacterium]
MTFPAHIVRVLDAYGVRADTKAALYDLYLTLGDEVLEVFADYSEGVTSAAMLEPDDTLTIRQEVVARYVRRNHPLWLAGKATPSLWHPREAEGRASGAAVPLGELPESVTRVVGENQPLPDGIVIVGRNAHKGGRADTISFDIIPRLLDEAVAVACAEGQQHTIPGSVGATTGTFDGIANLALLWEIQPNVYKPQGERNRALVKIWRRHRNWHLLTLACAFEWLRRQQTRVFVLSGSALAITHEMNPAMPLSELIVTLHDRTIAEVTRVLGIALGDIDDAEERELLESSVMNHALRKHVLVNGAAGAIRKAIIPSS